MDQKALQKFGEPHLNSLEKQERLRTPMHTLMTMQVVIGSNKHSLGKSPSPNSITAGNKSEALRSALIGMCRDFIKWAPEISVDSSLALASILDRWEDVTQLGKSAFGEMCTTAAEPFQFSWLRWLPNQTFQGQGRRLWGLAELRQELEEVL